MNFNLKRVLKILVISASIWSFLIGCWLWITPLTNSGSHFSDKSNFSVVPLLIPIIISLIAMWSIFKPKLLVLTSATLLFLIFWILSTFSIGLFYTPALILLVLALIIAIVEKWLSSRLALK